MHEGGTLKTQLDAELDRVAKLDAENRALRLDVQDLSRQVQTLLKEVYSNEANANSSYYPAGGEARQGSLLIGNVGDEFYRNTDDVISENLVTFRNIAELQLRNKQLLAVVRQLSDDRSKEVENQTTMLHQESKVAVQSALKELEELKGQRNRQVPL